MSRDSFLPFQCPPKFSELAFPAERRELTRVCAWHSEHRGRVQWLPGPRLLRAACTSRPVSPGFVHLPSYSLCPSLPPALGRPPASQGMKVFTFHGPRARAGRSRQLLGPWPEERDWLPGPVSARRVSSAGGWDGAGRSGCVSGQSLNRCLFQFLFYLL